MSEFLDGPIAESPMMTRRAPKFLRVAIDTENPDNHRSLDEIDAVPEPFENLCVYVLEGPASTHEVERPDGTKDRFIHGTYRHLPAEQTPPDSVLRDWKQWREWCAANLPKS